MSQVTVNRAAIERFMERQAFGGAVTGVGRTANRLADRMVSEAEKNASGRMMNMRTGGVARSVRKIVRKSPKTGVLEIGVGTVSEVGGHLANGTRAHSFGPSSPGVKYLVSNGPRSKGPNPTPLRKRQRGVKHPGNAPIPWLRDAVSRVIGRPV